MKILHRILWLAAAWLTLDLTAGRLAAQPADGSQDPQQQMRQRMQQFMQSMQGQLQDQGIDPQQLQDRIAQGLQQIDPQRIQQFMQSMQNRMQQQGIDPQQLQDRITQGLQQIDPQRIQQQVMEGYVQSLRETLGVTNDAEWSVIEGRLTKVLRSRADSQIDGFGMGRMAGGFGGFGGGRGGGNNPFGGAVRTLLGVQSLPEQNALQKAIDDHASSAEVRSALARFIEARKSKAALAKQDQEELRQVLTIRQESLLALMGILE
jgi:hypothetical protein